MIFVVGGSCQGKTEYVNENFGSGYQIIDAYQLKIREQLAKNLFPLEEAKKLLAGGETSRLVIVCDEVGCGVVPLLAKERIYRETVGRVGCYFAKEADRVFRIVCGIGTRIK